MLNTHGPVRRQMEASAARAGRHGAATRRTDEQTIVTNGTNSDITPTDRLYNRRQRLSTRENSTQAKMAVSRRLLRAAAREGYTHGSICNGRSVAADGFAGARGRRADQTSVGFEARDRTDGFTRERNGCEPV